MLNIKENRIQINCKCSCSTKEPRVYPGVSIRKSFEHEVELRAISQELPLVAIPDSLNFRYDATAVPVPGKAIRISLEELIREVRVSPTAPDWFLKTVASLVEKYGLAFTVGRSKLADEPIF